MERLMNYSGIALILGGFAFIITNAGISPFVDFEAPFRDTLRSSAFLSRMIFAGLTASFLLFGSIGIYLYHSQGKQSELVLLLTFLLAFFGSAFLIANEWHQIFILPEIARLSPQTIDRLDSSDSLNGYDLGAMIALVTFAIGWISLSVVVLMAKKLNRLGPVLVIAGFFIIPIVSGIISPSIGGMIGSIILGIGFGLMGSQLVKNS